MVCDSGGNWSVTRAVIRPGELPPEYKPITARPLQLGTYFWKTVMSLNATRSRDALHARYGKTNKFIFFSIRIFNSQTKFVCNTIVFLLLSSKFNPKFISKNNSDFQFLEFQFEKRSRNHEIIREKKGLFSGILTSQKNNA